VVLPAAGVGVGQPRGAGVGSRVDRAEASARDGVADAADDRTEAARDDAELAKQLAGLITGAGHQVWWDREIQGGSHFSSEIDKDDEANL